MYTLKIGCRKVGELAHFQDVAGKALVEQMSGA